ncbi:MAG: 5'(3')-deoxyribonucleotidase [Paraglaciecola sp.]|jgi:5'(3')-deoxyribonucleotidase
MISAAFWCEDDRLRHIDVLSGHRYLFDAPHNQTHYQRVQDWQYTKAIFP